MGWHSGPKGLTTNKKEMVSNLVASGMSLYEKVVHMKIGQSCILKVLKRIKLKKHLYQWDNWVSILEHSKIRLKPAKYLQKKDKYMCLSILKWKWNTQWSKSIRRRLKESGPVRPIRLRNFSILQNHKQARLDKIFVRNKV